ncbi:MAG TPA: hypothetical protein VFZ69_03775 [Longimicrobiales bacterium]
MHDASQAKTSATDPIRRHGGRAASVDLTALLVGDPLRDAQFNSIRGGCQ